MDKKNILVLFGGVSPEHEISKISADTILRHLSEEKYRIVPVYITKNGKWLLYEGAIDHVKNIALEKFGTPAVLSPDRINRGLLRIVGDKVKTIPIDAVFPVLHGENGEDGTIQGLAALAGLPCVGSGTLAAAACMDKAFTRMIAAHIGLLQTKYLVFDKTVDYKAAATRIRKSLGLPCFIKPASAGSSLGITKALDRATIIEGLELASTICGKIMAERAVSGREIEYGVLGMGDNIKVSLPGEIIHNAEFYDYNAKYNSVSQTIVPAELPPDILTKMQDMAANIFRAVNASGLARVDFFLTDEGKIIFNEINTMPGFTPISLFPAMWEASNISLSELLDILIEIAFKQ
ncbi:MAG: D-alanine--D-alanine ligase [Turicibacter sp.]|nr:D-alanine--D-alanine ligase [Turicibacter sp.]